MSLGESHIRSGISEASSAVLIPWAGQVSHWDLMGIKAISLAPSFFLAESGHHPFCVFLSALLVSENYGGKVLSELQVT